MLLISNSTLEKGKQAWGLTSLFPLLTLSIQITILDAAALEAVVVAFCDLVSTYSNYLRNAAKGIYGSKHRPSAVVHNRAAVAVDNDDDDVLRLLVTLLRSYLLKYLILPLARRSSAQSLTRRKSPEQSSLSKSSSNESLPLNQFSD